MERQVILTSVVKISQFSTMPCEEPDLQALEEFISESSRDVCMKNEDMSLTLPCEPKVL